jgi:FkbM family methyltransferase
MLKLIFLVPHLSTGGMPQYLLKQIELIKDDIDVYCIEWADVTGGKFIVQRERIKKLLGDKLITLGEDKNEIFSLIKKINPTIIHLQEIPEIFPLPNSVTIKLYDINRNYSIIETSHDSSFNIKNKIYFPDKFIMVSQYQINEYQKLDIPCELVEYPIEYFKKTKSKEEIQKELGFDPNLKHVINVGLFTPRKNQSEVIEYAKKLINYPIQFHFIGNQADNFKDYWDPLMMEFPSNCKWWDERSDVDNFYQVADLFLFTSRGTDRDKETMPLVIREAISWQVPSLIYNLPVYLNYFDKYSNIEYLDFNEQSKNIEIIMNKLGITISEVDKYFDISFDKSNNKISIIYKKQEYNNYKISVKDKDSNAPIYWTDVLFAPNSSHWIIPIPIHTFDFYKSFHFGSFLIEFYDKKNNLIFVKDLFLKVPKPNNKFKLNLINNFDCLFNNYNEMFVDGKYDCYELDKMETVFDIGANNGLFSVLAINKGVKKVYAFEPNQESLINLRQLIKDMNVEVIDKAIHIKDEDIVFYIDPNNTTIGSISEDHVKNNGSKVEKITVPATSLKTFFEKNKIENLSLLKMDIEGGEYDIIENLEDEVFEKIDNFLIEYHNNTDGRVEKLVTILIKKGFNIDQIRNQNTIDNKIITDSYLTSPIGTIYAKKYKEEKLSTTDNFKNLNKKVLVEKSNINLFDIYNGHFNVKYKGVPYLKCPMDYVIYQMIIMDIKPDLIIEIGTFKGGGALYYADLLYLLGKGQVHTINLDNEVYDQKVFNHNQIKFFYGGFDSYDIEKNVKGFEKILVIDDASHTYGDVLKSLNKFSKIVSKNSYFIVEDGVVSFNGIADRYDGGPRKAINEFLQTNENFVVDRNLCDFFGINATFNPDGYLKKIRK